MVLPQAPRKRKIIHLSDHDYSQPGGYFVTLVTHNRSGVFGYIENGSILLSKIGIVVRDMLIDLPSHFHNLILDEYCIMPDHVHMILMLIEINPNGQKRETIQEIIRGYKSFSARKINAMRGTTGDSVWQRGYYEEVIESERELDIKREYIFDNPARYENNH